MASLLDGAFVQDFAQRVPTVDVAGSLSPFANNIPGAAAQGQSTRRAPLLTNAPRAQQSLANKYSGYMRELQQQYDPHIINAMREMDAQRVQKGQNPLSEEQTRRALQTAQSGQEATAPPEPSPFNFFGNAIRNVGDIVRSLPRLPGAMMQEARDLSKIGESIEAGSNPLSGLAAAPGVRMLPGAYLVENLAEGDVAELAANPVFTALDVLPLGNMLAKGTKVATAAREGAEAVARGERVATVKEARQLTQMTRRPMAAAINNTLDVDGNIVRTVPGEITDAITRSRMVRPLNQWFSQTQKDVIFEVNSAQQRVHNIVSGIQTPGDIATAGGKLDHLSRAAVKLRQDIVDLDPTIEARIPAITEKMVQGKWDELTGVDATAAEMYRSVMQETTEWSVANNYHVMFDGEVYDVQAGLKLKNAERRLNRTQQFNQLRNQMIAGTADPMTALRSLRDIYGRERRDPSITGRSAAEKLEDITTNRVGAAELNDARRMTLRSLESAGYDMDHFYTKRLNKKGREVKKLKTDDDLMRAVDDVLEGRVELPKRDLLNLDQVMEVVRANKSAYDGDALARLEAGIANREWKGVTKALESIRKQKGNAAVSDPLFVDSVRQLRDTSRELAKTTKYSDTMAERLAKRLADQQKMTPAARFLPEIDRQTRASVTAQLTDNLDANQRLIPADDAITVAQVVELADRGMWTEIPGWTEQMHRKIQRETVASWMDMKARGFDPMFIHTVPSNRLSRIMHPGESIVPNKPSSTNARKWDMAPGFKDFTIAVSDQMIEFLRRRETEIAVKHISDMVGESESVLRARYISTAEWRHAKAPVKSVEQHLQDLITENWTKFDPESMGYNWGSSYLNQLQQSDVLIPKTVANNLHDLSKPKQIAGGLFDPATKAFRIAVVGLSVRTQIYNIVGGVVSNELRAPGSMLRQMDKMRDYMQAVKTNDWSKLPQELQEVVGSQKATIMQMDDLGMGKTKISPTEMVYHYLRGKKQAEFFNAEQAAKTPGAPSKMSKAADGFERAAQKMYNLNGLFDDMYRVVSYWDEYERAIKKGHTGEAASKAGIAETRKVLQDWMGMTPMERATMKSLVPFYAFVSHAIRFVMQYPLDHPLRAEFMSKLAQSELEDMDGLPKRFLSSLFVGDMDEKGKQNALNLAPMNPFGDVANMMTIGGFLGATNPMISTAFQMVGLDQGEADLYPSLRYDAETGRLAAKSANPLLAMLDNTIPQTGLVTAMMGMNERFNEQLKTDPAAANRFLLSGLTMPILWREYSVPQEQFKAEVARYDSAEKVKNEALKTGDWSEALRYPSLAAYLQALDMIPPEQLSAFQRRTMNETRDIADSALGGTLQQRGPTGSLDDAVMAALQQQAATLQSGTFVPSALQGSGVRGAQPPALVPAGASLANTSVGGI